MARNKTKQKNKHDEFLYVQINIKYIKLYYFFLYTTLVRAGVPVRSHLQRQEVSLDPCCLDGCSFTRVQTLYMESVPCMAAPWLMSYADLRACADHMEQHIPWPWAPNTSKHLSDALRWCRCI